MTNLNSIWIITLNFVGLPVIADYDGQEFQWSETICAAADWLEAIALAYRKVCEMGWDLIKEDIAKELYETNSASFVETVDYDPDPDVDSVVPWGDLGNWHTLYQSVCLKEVPMGYPEA